MSSTPTAGTGTSSSGTILGVGQEYTVTYNMSWYGAEPSGRCIKNSTALTLMDVPKGTFAAKQQLTVTSITNVYKFSAVVFRCNLSTNKL